MSAMRISPSSCSDLARAEHIGRLATHCLRLEIDTHPKPGMVSYVDRGAHTDMDAALLRRSADVLAPFFVDLAAAGASCASMNQLRTIGLVAERAMLAATGGVNTHRGAIFGMGLLAAAAGLQGKFALSASLGRIVVHHWGRAIECGPAPLHSHGAVASRRYGVGGARVEAARGFPSIYGVAIPALIRGGQLAPSDSEAARVQACMALIARVDDTNLLHRGGEQGLLSARHAARTFLHQGGVGQVDWRSKALHMHAEFTARGLSPGGCADLLAMSLFVSTLQRAGSAR